jgi:hypothetical protein
MRSPFPGMDPYLEEPGLWPDVHLGFISEMQATLNRQLRPKYHVRVEERVYVSDENDPGRRVIIPDLRIAEQLGTSGAIPNQESALAVAEPVVTTILIEDEIHEARLEIIDRSQQQVVTVIEVVSPTNKVPGSRGRASYQQKRQEVLHSPSHWVEIDLLREGEGAVLREMLPRCHYTVHISRVEERPRARTWPIRLHQALPAIPIPLRAEDGDVLLDLPTVLTNVYDRGAYDMVINYRAEANPPLTGPDAAWADELLKSKGLR